MRTRFRYTPDIPLPQPTRTGEPIWLDPYPDELLGDIPDTAPGPEARYEARESVSLAFVTALQHLTPGQRTALVLRDVLGFSAAETADILGASLDAVNGALKRARAVIAEHLPPGQHDQAPLPGSAGERRIVARFADAFEHGDVANIVDLLTGDAWLTMPPLPFQYQGRAAAAEFLSAISFRGGSRQFRLVPTRANGQPAFGCYLRDARAPIAHAHGLIVLTWPATASQPSPVSWTTASSRSSDSPAPCPNNTAKRGSVQVGGRCHGHDVECSGGTPPDSARSACPV